ncbi:MAG: tRNA lysidine(34) synthetase TilS [Anaerolineae bacterium]|nr:tRNA lysidine(34) synthetase TilS [Anaerolineae bacterium]
MLNANPPTLDAHPLLEQVAMHLRAMQVPLHQKTVLVAVSGGVDSLVLLRALHALAPQFHYHLHVASYDHGLRGEAGRADARFCGRFCRHAGPAFHAGGGGCAAIRRAARLSVETAARQARYTFLVQTALALGTRLLAAGHHRDDQVETVLLHLLRGTGLRGLQGMAPLNNLSYSHILEDAPDLVYDAVEDMLLLRPLLDVPRAEIAAYAAALGLARARTPPTRRPPTSATASATRFCPCWRR